MIKDLKTLAIIAWVLLTIMYGVRLWVIMRLSGLGATAQTIIDQSDKLILENKVLENQIASKSALRTIDAEARRLGFKEAQIEYIK